MKISRPTPSLVGAAPETIEVILVSHRDPLRLACGILQITAIVVACQFLIVAPAVAQVAGKVTGTVADRDTGTGLPDQGGLEFVDSRNPQIPEDFLIDRTLRDFPFALTEFQEEWRDEFSRQDLDGDGWITLQESQETLFRGSIARNNGPLNYGSPWQIRFGAEIRF